MSAGAAGTTWAAGAMALLASGEVEAVLATAQILGESFAQVGVAVLVVAQAGPRRGRYVTRVLVAALAIGAYALAGAAAAVALGTTYALQAATYLVLVAVLTGAVLWCHEVSALTALCYATCGYAAQNLAMTAFTLVTLVAELAGAPIDGSLGDGLYLASFVVVDVGLWLLFARRARRRGVAEADDAATLLVAAFVVAVVIVYDLVLKSVTGAVGTAELVVLRAVQVMACAFVVVAEYELLYRRRLRREAEAAGRALAEASRHYELSREAVQAVNVACHDLRHQIRDLREAGGVDEATLAELERQLGTYDAAVRTGCDALDVIVAQKRLVCVREGIELTCVADGRALAGLDTADLYALVGNALDNAIDAVRGLPEDGRTVSLTLREVCGMASLHVENPYAGTVRFGSDGLPATTEGGGAGSEPGSGPSGTGAAGSDRGGAGAARTPGAARHGLGTRSMRMVCERHGGTLVLTAHDGTFVVDALVPVDADGA